MMKKIYIMMCMLVSAFTLWAQDDAAKVAMRAIVADDKIPAEAAASLETRLQRALTANGFSDNSCTGRFVLTAKADITNKDVVASTPARVSQAMELTLIVGDVVENKIYETCTVSLSGIGTTETKAFMSAFAKVNPSNSELQQMLVRAKEKIVAFYADNCETIIKRAKTQASIGCYDEAIAMLVDVPLVCKDCFDKCQSTALAIYNDKIDAESTVLVQKARTAWMAEPNAVGAAKVASLISHISPRSSVYPEVAKLRSEVSAKLRADERQQWDMEMKKYSDSMALKRSIVKACRDVGVAWGNGQPRTVTKTIISRWW